jgi:hypothetical protein
MTDAPEHPRIRDARGFALAAELLREQPASPRRDAALAGLAGIAAILSTLVGAEIRRRKLQ